MATSAYALPAGPKEVSRTLQPGHWLPSLRPEDLTASPDAVKSTPSATPPPPADRVGVEPRGNELLSATRQDADILPGVKDVPISLPPAPDHGRVPISTGSTLPWSLLGSGSAAEDDDLPSEDDNERLDPAWGFTQTDSAQILSDIKRSTTFPELPTPTIPTPAAVDVGQQSSRAADPFDLESKDARAYESDEQGPRAIFEGGGIHKHATGATEPRSLDWMSDDRDGSRDAHFWTVSDRDTVVDDIDQRFEEGVPLVQTSDSASTATHPPLEDHLAATFEKAGEDDDTFLLSELNGDAPIPAAPAPLDRKSTSEVLQSLHLPDAESKRLPAMVDEDESNFYDQLANAQEPQPDQPDQPGQSEPQAAEDADAMWAAAFEDDDFLVEDPDDLLPDSPSEPSPVPGESDSNANFLTGDRPLPAAASGVGHHRAPEPQTPGRRHEFDQRVGHDATQISPTFRSTYNTIGLSRPQLAPMSSYQFQLNMQQQQQLQPPAPMQSVKSFVDQAKDGYKSPYDLPVDISKPRKRAHAPQAPQPVKAIVPPPRSSSLSETPHLNAGANATATTPTLPPAPAPPQSPQARRASTLTRSSTVEPSKAAKFFEELPMTSRPRPGTGHGRYTPQQGMDAPAQPLPPQGPPAPALPSSPPQLLASPPQMSDRYAEYQLRPAARLDPYANVPLQQARPAPPAPVTRYSPAPVSSTVEPRPAGAPTRYSPAPPSQPKTSSVSGRYSTPPGGDNTAPSQLPPMPSRYVSQPLPDASAGANLLPFQPRTSSPLAYHRSAGGDAPAATVPYATQPGPIPRQASAAQMPHFPVASPPQSSTVSDNVTKPSMSSRPGTGQLPPPRRSLTQSPSKQRPQQSMPSHNNDGLHRPASAYGVPQHRQPMLPMEPVMAPSFGVHADPLADMEFIRPVDETQFDPLERWKGAPIFRFGFGGSAVSSFPKRIPRYSAGLVKPQIKSHAGDISMHKAKSVGISSGESLCGFPGPLRSKSKKKDLLAWMSSHISSLESNAPHPQVPHTQHEDPTRHYEKILLWQIVRVLVENDGILDGPAALKAVNMVLNPDVQSGQEFSATQHPGVTAASGIYRPVGAQARTESTDPTAIEGLRKLLLGGDRQSAVTHAMDNRLWSHALIISSTMDRSMWSQVVREFVRQEVKTVGANAEPLSALYEMFGGNFEDSIDELVPPSARAGLQMMNKAEAPGATKNALEGLNRWKETLSLVLNNRSQGDHEALAILGKLLEDYNRIEAAHICYLFSRNAARPVVFGGLDDERASIVLLGANHKARPFECGRDEESIVLTEVYEFATNVLAAGSATAFMAHLSAFKLQRALTLADQGLITEAQAYCDAIAATFRSSTKMSLYNHPLLLGGLDELSTRLRQAPAQGASSWIGKPSLEKVSGSMWTKFSSFVAGDDSDAESKGSGKDATEAGPFANVTGTPSISRSGSQSDLYGPYLQGVATSVAGSRYAPSGAQPMPSPSDLTRERASIELQRSPPSFSGRQSHDVREAFNPFHQGSLPAPANMYQNFPAAPASAPHDQVRPQSSYIPTGASQRPATPRQASMSARSTEEPLSHNYESAPVQSEPIAQSLPQADPLSDGSYENIQTRDLPNGQLPREPIVADNEPAPYSYGFEFSQSSTYVPYVPEPDSPEADTNEKPAKLSYLDDEEDDQRRTSERSPTPDVKSQADDDAAARRRANDATAAAAFRAAAEADATRSNEAKDGKRSSSWFGGWLGSKKSVDGLGAGASKGADSKVYRANLGESKMKLYYDKELGKWVNPDNPDAAKPSPTPPPPKMGPTSMPASRPKGPPTSVNNGPVPDTSIGSRMTGTPPAPPSRGGTPAMNQNIASQFSSTTDVTTKDGTPPLASTSTPPLPPPPSSRPSTAMSNSSSIDDLIGPATGRKTAKGKKGGRTGRYVDVMAK